MSERLSGVNNVGHLFVCFIRNKLHWSISLHAAPSCYAQSRLGSGRIEIHSNVYYNTGTRFCCPFDGPINDTLPSRLTPRMLFFNETNFRIWQCSSENIIGQQCYRSFYLEETQPDLNFDCFAIWEIN